MLFISYCPPWLQVNLPICELTLFWFGTVELQTLLWMTDCIFFFLDCKLPWAGTIVYYTFVPHLAQSLDQRSVGNWVHQVRREGQRLNHALPGQHTPNRLPTKCGSSGNESGWNVSNGNHCPQLACLFNIFHTCSLQIMLSWLCQAWFQGTVENIYVTSPFLIFSFFFFILVVVCLFIFIVSKYTNVTRCFWNSCLFLVLLVDFFGQIVSF